MTIVLTSKRLRHGSLKAEYRQNILTLRRLHVLPGLLGLTQEWGRLVIGLESTDRIYERSCKVHPSRTHLKQAQAG